MPQIFMKKIMAQVIDANLQGLAARLCKG